MLEKDNDGYGIAIEYVAGEEEIRIAGTIFNQKEQVKSLNSSNWKKEASGQVNVDFMKIVDCEDPKLMANELGRHFRSNIYPNDSAHTSEGLVIDTNLNKLLDEYYDLFQPQN